ncbi:MAG: prolyl oligopeptidase family serine peptidase [Chitinophagales bacterium]|nr:prolyl oligopeptidase family serine peptidase [Chitinophagales bacterium]MDW8394009.1 prolyl oligopeptidase family serine peptidase [Chitinophagales bacterium]
MRLVVACCLLLNASLAALAQKITYPQTRKTDVTDVYFGTPVADPYRWLEDDHAEETKAWVQEQNKVTFGYLEQIPYRDKIRQRITELYNYPRMSVPFRAGSYYFFSRNDGLQPQSVYYIQKGLSGTPEVFIDPNKMNEKGTSAVSLSGFSKDRRFVCYNVSESGSDWQTMYVKEVATGKVLQDELKWIKFSGASWYRDGFFYSGYQQPEKGQELKGQNRFHRVYYHKLGTPQSEDMVVWEDRERPLRYVQAQVTEDERYLIIYISEGTDGTEVWYMDLRNKHAGFRRVFEGFAYNYEVIDNEGDDLLVHTNFGAKNYRLIRLHPQQPQTTLKEVIAERPELLQGVQATGGRLFATYLKDATSQVVQFARDGRQERVIALPSLGTVSGFAGEKDDTLVFYSLTSFTTPSTLYQYSIRTGQSKLYRQPEVRFNPDQYETKQIFYSSKDGTRVPMFIVYKKGLKRNGRNPTLLYGYGGFNIALTPSFSPTRMALLEQGAVFALANLRGGSEYGEAWHEAGMLLKKQNVFDDFIAAAEYLIRERYTSRDYLAIIGRSNGGLLVGAVINQRPDLFQVAFPGVGVMDMLRFHKFTVGWGWVVEYGSSDDSVHFRNLYSYSPLHNLKKGVCYPATLITTADHDDRVVPAHSFKYAATLQEVQACQRPVLIRIDVQAGHGGGRPVSKVIEEDTDIYAFMFWNMGIRQWK